MELRALIAVLARRRAIRRHQRWDRGELAYHQERALAALRDHAMTRSRFYQRFHRGLESASLYDLPVLTKATLMEHFDDLVADPEVKLADALAYLEGDAEELFRGRYVVCATSGSTGRRGIFLYDRDEWMTHIASYARAQEWAGVAAGLTHKVRMAVVSSRVPWHGSARVGQTVHSRFVPTLRLDATEPLPETVEQLNAFQPDCLVGYASMLHVLAAEQLAGRLRVAPRAVMSASEVLTDETKARARAAWGSDPYDVYAATETADIASDCARHRKHLYEDLVIVESVDEHHRPVPAGTVGASVLVTVLFSRTQPLIRYQMSDRVALSSERCDCGIGFALLDRVEGRAEDIVELPARVGGVVAVHPNVFHRVLELVPAAAWQVIAGRSGVRVLLERPGGADLESVARAVGKELARQGVAELPVRAEAVDAIPRTALGKAPLVTRAA
ncbi:MAG: phenylacetate--CoA ligase family protein [Kofleriaceae bacterium]|nr:MAG: phenylacetate--CoA ligase family protein [Kofleriaceae bacterium]